MINLKFFSTFADISESVSYSEISNLSNKTKVLWDYYSVGLYVVVNLEELGFTVLWDRKTTVMVRLRPKFKVQIFNGFIVALI